MASHATQLGGLVGLDDETVKEQVLPYLETFSSKQALVNHLETLLGPGPAQQAFIGAYTHHRFPLASVPKPAPPPDTPAPAPSDSPYASKTGSARKPKSKFPSKLPAPRKVNAESFGEIGSVYRKGYDEEPLKASGAGKASDVHPNALPSVQAALTPTPSPRPTSSLAQTSRADVRVADQEQEEGLRGGASSARGSFEGGRASLIPTEEMKGLQDTIALLRGDSVEDPMPRAKPCFCQARRHPLHPHVPLCLTCGLILCSILSPSPMLLPSPPCPSCASPLLDTTNRAILLTKLDMELASLAQEHEEKIRLIREERQRAWKEKREEVDLFPNLQLQPFSTSNHTAAQAGSSKTKEYNYFYERRRAMDVAMGRKVDDSGERKSRVLRIESKSTKGKAGKGSGGKKRKGKEVEGGKGKEEQRAQQPSSLQVAEEAKVPAKAIEPEEEEADSEEETGLGYDSLHEEAPMADPDDDGFALHATSFPPELAAVSPRSPGWWEDADVGLPSIRYVAKQDRTRDQAGVDYVDEDQPSVPAPRSIPGAAKEEPSEKSKPSKGKKAKEKESGATA